MNPAPAAKGGISLVAIAVIAVVGLIVMTMLNPIGLAKTSERQQGHTDRVDSRTKRHLARVNRRKQATSQRNCRKVCCDKRFLLFCTHHDPHCYNNCEDKTA